MKNAIYFKALQKKLHFRNPKSIIIFNEEYLQTYQILDCDLIEAQRYILNLQEKGIQYTYPGHVMYPEAFLKMLEPPLFFEYLGTPCWMNGETLSVVGSRKIHPLTQQWIEHELSCFVSLKPDVVLVSGGAEGVDQCVHLLSIKKQRPTIVILPCGLNQIFPISLRNIIHHVLQNGGCILSEFESYQTVRKSYFFFRNRLIAALSSIIFVVQAERKSGTFLTVHHALQNGRCVITLPAHPMMSEFSGNRHLIKEGAFFVCDKNDLLHFWDAENWPGRGVTNVQINP